MANKTARLSAAATLVVAVLSAQKPPPQPRIRNDEKIQTDKDTQSLGTASGIPLVSIGETSRLVFHVSPLSREGLLSQQTRDALKAILKLNGGEQIVHIRAFSAGNGDMRRIPQIITDVLEERRGPLPSVSVLQVGALTLNGAQVLLETVSAGKKQVNKGGLTFHPAEEAVAGEPNVALQLLLQKSLDRLAAKMNGKPALAVTCFVSVLDDAPDLMRMIATRFPGAAADLVQARRLARQTSASCEGVSRDSGAGAARIAFTGTQVAFGLEQKDAELAFQRLDRALVEAGAPRTNAALLRLYTASPGAAALTAKQMEGISSATTVSIEGVGSVTAGFALDAVVPVP